MTLTIRPEIKVEALFLRNSFNGMKYGQCFPGHYNKVMIRKANTYITGTPTLLYTKRTEISIAVETKGGSLHKLSWVGK